MPRAEANRIGKSGLQSRSRARRALYAQASMEWRKIYAGRVQPVRE
jgi:hypothetical protein